MLSPSWTVCAEASTEVKVVEVTTILSAVMINRAIYCHPSNPSRIYLERHNAQFEYLCRPIAYLLVDNPNPNLNQFLHLDNSWWVYKHHRHPHAFGKIGMKVRCRMGCMPQLAGSRQRAFLLPLKNQF
jgi:hypothetical protein